MAGSNIVPPATSEIDLSICSNLFLFFQRTLIPRYNCFVLVHPYNILMPVEKLKMNDAAAVSSENKRIYILDDDESVCRSLKLLLVSYGFAVKVFSSAEEFFRDVRNKALGCLILDIHMPGLNGWDTQQRLTKEGYRLPVIVITADKDDRFKEQALKAGAVGFLQKPFKEHYLLHMVNQVFNGTNEIRGSIKNNIDKTADTLKKQV